VLGEMRDEYHGGHAAGVARPARTSEGPLDMLAS
jgi:hypothetical protein